MESSEISSAIAGNLAQAAFYSASLNDSSLALADPAQQLCLILSA
jgi:hypothetical protein